MQDFNNRLAQVGSYSNDVTFRQLHESIKSLSAAVSSLIRQEEEDRPMREELIRMLPDILATLADEDDKDNQEEDNQ